MNGFSFKIFFRHVDIHRLIRRIDGVCDVDFIFIGPEHDAFPFVLHRIDGIVRHVQIQAVCLLRWLRRLICLLLRSLLCLLYLFWLLRRNGDGPGRIGCVYGPGAQHRCHHGCRKLFLHTYSSMYFIY